VFLNTTLQQESTPYALVVNGITDVWGLPILPNTRVRFTSFTLANGFLTREIFEDIKGTDVEDLVSSEKYIRDYYDRLAGATSFETPVNDGVFYGQRVCGYLTPPETGDYVFVLTAADAAELWLSKDEVLTNTALIARVLLPARPYQWTNEFNQVSGAITLQAGERYYLEVLHKAGGTNDHAAVAWTLPSQAGRSNTLAVIPGDFLSTYVNPDAADIVITLQPTNTTVPENRTATFTVAATGSSALGTNILYQWLKDGTVLAGATLPSHTTPPVKKIDSGSRYQCAISVPGKTVFSAEALLTVSEPVDLPPLFILRKPPEVVVGWISAVTNLVLESTANLTTSVWTIAPELVVQDGTTNLVLLPALDTRFFRLRSP
jgi:hypothetical protein